MASTQLAALARLPARQFRTMLRLLAAGLHVAQAHELLARRSAAGLEVLADDVNALLASCLFTSAPRAAAIYLARLKRCGRLVGRDEREVVAACGELLARCDMGAHDDLADARRRRSPDMHVQRQPLDAGAGAGAGAGVGRKRQRDPATAETRCDGATASSAAVMESAGACPGVGASADADTPCGADALGIAEAPGSVVPGVLSNSDTTVDAECEAGHGVAACAETSEAASAAFKHYSARLQRQYFEDDEGRKWAPARFRRAADVFESMASPPEERATRGPEPGPWWLPSVPASSSTFTSAPSSSSTLSSSSLSSPVSSSLHEASALASLLSLRPPQLRFGGLGVAPNARSFVVMLYGALEAGDAEQARRIFALLRASNTCAADALHEVMQPSFLLRLAAAGILSPTEVEAALTAPPDSPKWFFLKAASEAMKGDQFGSKHGAVLTRAGRYAAHGRNHRFASAGDARVRVMHSEVHAIVRLPSLEAAAGCECWVVELDGHGVGYEEAVPCPMCNKAVHRLGMVRVHYSSHAGVKSEPVAHRPHLVCESLEAALLRRYPAGTVDPDDGDDAGFDFFSAQVTGDPGRGKVVAMAAHSSCST